MALQIIVSPSRKLRVEFESTDEPTLKLAEAFACDSGRGLLSLDSAKIAPKDAGESISYWRDFVHLYLSLFLATPDLESADLIAQPVAIQLPSDELKRFVLTVPPVMGAEYVNEDYLLELWTAIGRALAVQIQEFGRGVAAFFSARSAGQNLLGRVCFHLAENKNSNDAPFAFLATYVRKVESSISGELAKHLPLKKALEEYSKTNSKNDLLRLLAPIHRASKESAFIKSYVESGDIYHTLAWSAQEAYQFLKDIPMFEKAGVAVRVPNWWKRKQERIPRIEMRIGNSEPKAAGFDAMMDFNASLFLGDTELSEDDIRELAQRSNNLTFFKGQWVEVDKDKLQNLLEQWKRVSKNSAAGLTFADGLRLHSGLDSVESKAGEDGRAATMIRVVGGEWFNIMLERIRDPKTSTELQATLDDHLRAKLRPYQSKGVAWLHTLSQLRLGAILADDMGLGKTIQVISLLLLHKHLKKSPSTSSSPSLLVVPASLIGNWKTELNRFAPTLQYWVAHQSMDGILDPEDYEPDLDLVITTYNSVPRLNWMEKRNWKIIVLDEAQAIKNPGAKQTRAIKNLKGEHRLALTGTPVENHLSDLWSIFDFLSPSLLGSEKDFDRFIKRKDTQRGSNYAILRSLISPYILRRMKTDKSIISDLPDKTEMKTWCQLSKTQVALYLQAVTSLKADIANAQGIERSGIIFAYLMRFKQICNHPAHWLKDGLFSEQDSGKFMRLREICEVIRDKQEKVLVFTQFKEMTEPLAEFLSNIFGKAGLVLHGSKDIKQRASMVANFQRDDGPPFFVLSLKAGGSGLNLTNASHVIHFDRWWNPAVENQATDRAFRIGQKRNVLVHKFICQGTIEDRIDALIESKLNLSKDILAVEANTFLTELSNTDLLNLVSLDINTAVAQST